MLTPEQREIATEYLRAKEQWSRENDWLVRDRPRASVPALVPLAAREIYHDHYGNPYTGDPLHGVVDFYTHPMRLMAALIAGPASVARLFIDCDDVALLYASMVRQVAGYTVNIITLIDSGIAGSHVICTYTGPGGVCGALDTNGHHVLANLDEQTICDHWTSIYASLGYHYIGALITPDPFR